METLNTIFNLSSVKENLQTCVPAWFEQLKESSFDAFHHSHKKWNSLEIRVVKLRFLLIYENMLKSIATNRSECTAAKHENKASYNTDYIVLDLIDLKRDQNAGWKKKYS